MSIANIQQFARRDGNDDGTGTGTSNSSRDGGNEASEPGMDIVLPYSHHHNADTSNPNVSNQTGTLQSYQEKLCALPSTLFAFGNTIGSGSFQ